MFFSVPIDAKFRLAHAWAWGSGERDGSRRGVGFRKIFSRISTSNHNERLTNFGIMNLRTETFCSYTETGNTTLVYGVVAISEMREVGSLQPLRHEIYRAFEMSKRAFSLHSVENRRAAQRSTSSRTSSPQCSQSCEITTSLAN